MNPSDFLLTARRVIPSPLVFGHGDDDLAGKGRSGIPLVRILRYSERSPAKHSALAEAVVAGLDAFRSDDVQESFVELSQGNRTRRDTQACPDTSHGASPS